jgi:hypothetical protein
MLAPAKYREPLLGGRPARFDRRVSISLVAGIVLMVLSVVSFSAFNSETEAPKASLSLLSCTTLVCAGRASMSSVLKSVKKLRSRLGDVESSTDSFTAKLSRSVKGASADLDVLDSISEDASQDETEAATYVRRPGPKGQKGPTGTRGPQGIPGRYLSVVEAPL